MHFRVCRLTSSIHVLCSVRYSVRCCVASRAGTADAPPIIGLATVHSAPLVGSKPAAIEQLSGERANSEGMLMPLCQCQCTMRNAMQLQHLMLIPLVNANVNVNVNSKYKCKCRT